VSDHDGERVLAVPTAVLRRAGLFQGFHPDAGRYLPALLDPAALAYLPRAQAEHDPEFKQLIPYVVLRCRGRVFHYTRGGSGTESRLRAKRSLGVGGHINGVDGAPSQRAYRAGMLRELDEEVELGSGYAERCLGLINDDSTPVGQVHLGVVHLLDLEEPRARCREETLVAGGFAPVAELRRDAGAFETWSQLLLAGDWLER
jgi:predicted NUDIX family phosphoesterase